MQVLLRFFLIAGLLIFGTFSYAQEEPREEEAPPSPRMEMKKLYQVFDRSKLETRDGVKGNLEDGVKFPEKAKVLEGLDETAKEGVYKRLKTRDVSNLPSTCDGLMPLLDRYHRCVETKTPESETECEGIEGYFTQYCMKKGEEGANRTPCECTEFYECDRPSFCPMPACGLTKEQLADLKHFYDNRLRGEEDKDLTGRVGTFCGFLDGRPDQKGGFFDAIIDSGAEGDTQLQSRLPMEEVSAQSLILGEGIKGKRQVLNRLLRDYNPLCSCVKKKHCAIDFCCKPEIGRMLDLYEECSAKQNCSENFKGVYAKLCRKTPLNECRIMYSCPKAEECPAPTEGSGPKSHTSGDNTTIKDTGTVVTKGPRTADTPGGGPEEGISGSGSCLSLIDHPSPLSPMAMLLFILTSLALPSVLRVRIKK